MEIFKLIRDRKLKKLVWEETDGTLVY